MNDAEIERQRRLLNIVLHEPFGKMMEPCESGCTHVLLGEWTALGAANVLARAGAVPSEEQGEPE